MDLETTITLLKGAGVGFEVLVKVSIHFFALIGIIATIKWIKKSGIFISS